MALTKCWIVRRWFWTKLQEALFTTMALAGWLVQRWFFAFLFYSVGCTGFVVMGNCYVCENEQSIHVFIADVLDTGRGQVQQWYPHPFADNSRIGGAACSANCDWPNSGVIITSKWCTFKSQSNCSAKVPFNTVKAVACDLSKSDWSQFLLVHLDRRCILVWAFDVDLTSVTTFSVSKKTCCFLCINTVTKSVV